jgi:hypothetical protein
VAAQTLLAYGFIFHAMHRSRHLPARCRPQAADPANTVPYWRIVAGQRQ